MKKNILFILGTAAWLLVLATVIVNKYNVHQQAIAASLTGQDKLVSQHEASLEIQATNAAQQTNLYKQQATVLQNAHQEVCDQLQSAITYLTKNHVINNVTLPKTCE